jgi:diguanylate cyclase (GGDEF)-like protein/PAS domain S-box-containing protein
MNPEFHRNTTRITTGGFIAVLLVLISIGIVSVRQVTQIRNDVENLFNHPFMVSNAARAASYHFMAMQHNLDSLVSHSQDNDKTITDIDRHEAMALENFKTISMRFLGDKTKVSQAYNTFVGWKPIRRQVINLALAGQKFKAVKLLQTEGMDYTERLTREVEELVQLSEKNARSFRDNALEKETNSITFLIILSSTSILLSILIAVYVLHNLFTTHKELVHRQHLIDQNIMIATLDSAGRVKEATRALCSFMGTTPREIKGKSGFFDPAEEPAEKVKTIQRTVESGRKWKGEIKHVEDGQVRWAQSTILPNYNRTWELTGFTNILVDTTTKKLSETDSLTGLLNRRRFEEVLPREIRLARRHNRPITLAILDIDYFKKYNDLYGHPEGDKALKALAAVFQENLKRPNDFAFRVGGEEFAIVFSGLDEVHSGRYLELIRERVEDRKILHEASTINKYMTISIGARIIYPQGPVEHQQLYCEADKALYHAKQKRNQVILES